MTPKFEIGQVVKGLPSKDVPGVSQDYEVPIVIGRVDTIFFEHNGRFIYNVSTVTMAEQHMSDASEFAL